MTTERTILESRMYITAAQTDKFGKVAVSAIAGILEDLAWRHAEELSFGYDDLKKQNLLWVLARLKTKVHQRPVWRQNIVGKTWTCGIDGAFARREFSIEDEEGNVLIEAVSHWLVIDADTHRMVRISSIGDMFPCSREKQYDWTTSKLPVVESKEEPNYRDVLYSEIDLNNHMNNAKYLQRVIDSVDLETISKVEIIGYEINFLSEAKMGDRLGVIKDESGDNDYLFAVCREEDSKELVRAKVDWKFR